ncbi:unnamed protein product [Chironomus riparius]|uniref:Activating transcription factor 7-interacting protein Fn3 domain-containing protein n=1 Tax=Chironomus riparius TaxID=315576 RepID=A0A9N9WYQ2_9DIPT|nr:unnamed protein product [Chironomus riparius]
MSSTQETVNKSISVDDMLDEIPEPPIINHQHQINNDKISDSDDSFKSIENFVPIKLKFIKKFAKVSGKIAKDDLEELLLLKVTESMVYRTKYAEIRVKLDIYEDLMQRQRTRLELLEKQYADLQVTHERILTAMRENPQAPIEPLKIVRAVSCQVYQQSAEYVNTDPIVIGDSPKKKRTRRRINENLTEKGKKERNDKVGIDSSDEHEENNRKVTRSSERKQDKSKENKSFEDRSSNKQINDDKLNQTGSSTKNTSNSSEKELESNKKQTKTADQNSSRSKNNKTTDSQKSSKSNQNPEENELNSSNFDKVLTFSESNQAQIPNNRGTKRKATTILEMFEKKAKNSTEDTKDSANNQKSKTSKENKSKNRSRSSQESDSDNDVTLIEDDEDKPKTKRQQTLKFSSELDFELPRALKKLAKATKLIESSAKTTDNKLESKTDNITSKSKKTDEKSINITSKIDKLTSNISKNTKNDDKTVKQSNLTSKSGSSSPDSNIRSPESVLSSSPEPEHSIPVQKSFKVPTTKPKAIRPGPKCSKLSNQIVGTGKLEAGDSIPQESSSLLEVSNKLLNGSNRFENNFKNPQNMARNLQNGGSNLYKNVNYPSSATKIPPSPFDSAKKSSNFDQSFDSLNFSSCSSLDTLSSFKSSANLVTSTPLKAVDQGQAKTVKRTLDMNFNENSSSKVPKLPTRGPQLIHPSLKQSIPAPTIKVEKVNNGIRISWRIDNFKASDHADVQSYQIYAYEEMPGSAKISTDDWKLVGDVKALLLPMAVTLREFNENQKFHFAIRAVDVHKRLGEFSEPKSWE